MHSPKIHISNSNRLHTGDQPYPCTACGEGFRTKAELNQHNRATHGGLNPNSANTTIVVSGSQQQQMVSMIFHSGKKIDSCLMSVLKEKNTNKQASKNENGEKLSRNIFSQLHRF